MKVLPKSLVVVVSMLLLVLSGCGEPNDSVTIVDDSNVDTTDVGVEDINDGNTGNGNTENEDAGNEDAGDQDTDENSGTPDVGDNAANNQTPSVDSELHTERFFGAGLELIPGASLRMPFELTQLTTDIELFVIRNLRGYNEVQNQENGAIVMAVNNASFQGPEVGWVNAPLPQGMYDMYLSNIGTSSSAGTDYIAAKVIESPYYDPAYAAFESHVVDHKSFVDPGVGTREHFYTRSDSRYVIRGLRGNNTVIIVNADQLPLIEDQQPFATEYIWDENDPEIAPAAMELDLAAPDHYVLIVVNNAGDDNTHASVVVVDEWRLQ